MCGFTGYINKPNKKTIKKMTDTIKHRGPDSEGFYIDDFIALGFRRLAILDIKNGNQPLYSYDKNYIICFNGEIYNYLELKKELLKLGHKFKTKTDTEVLLNGFIEYGPNILNKLRGMFAFIIYDKKNKKLFGARDIFGIKPFYYYLKNKDFIFGSEIKSFLKNKNFNKELNEKVLKNYLTFQYSPMEETFFKNTYKLLPGHYFIYEENTFKRYKYFNFSYQNDNNNLENIIDNINKLTKESIKYHQISDVKLGAFLSSGIDSSYLVALSKIKNTYTVGFKENGFNEIKEAQKFSKILNIQNKNQLITPDMFFKAIPKVQYYSDEPHANLSAVPLYYLAKLASKEVKVVLSGEGADELFGGYHWYNEDYKYKIYRKIPFIIRNIIKKIVFNLPNFKGKHFLIQGGSKLEDYYIGQAFIMDDKEANKILNKKYQTKENYKQITQNIFSQVKNKDDIIKKMYLDMHLWLPSDILLKADKMSMASSLELRVPYLDKKIFAFSTHIGVKYILNGNTTKYAFRKATEKILPEKWSTRPKIGFLVPFKNWLKEEKYYQIIKKEFNKEYVNELFNKKRINKLLDDHYYKNKNNARKIYTIYSFLVWYDIYFGR